MDIFRCDSSPVTSLPTPKKAKGGCPPPPPLPTHSFKLCSSAATRCNTL